MKKILVCEDEAAIRDFVNLFSDMQKRNHPFCEFIA